MKPIAIVTLWVIVLVVAYVTMARPHNKPTLIDASVSHASVSFDSIIVCEPVYVPKALRGNVREDDKA